MEQRKQDIYLLSILHHHYFHLFGGISFTMTIFKHIILYEKVYMIYIKSKDDGN